MDVNKQYKIESLPQHLLSVNDLNTKQINRLYEIIDGTSSSENFYKKPSLNPKTVALCFFQPSTRTRISFEKAAQNLCANVLGFSNKESTRASGFTNESFGDVIKVLNCHADLIIIRHYDTLSSIVADSSLIKLPIINAGDQNNEHPTQALADAYLIWKHLGEFSNLSVGIMGNLETRVHRSFILLLIKMGVKTFNLLLPPNINTVPPYLAETKKENNIDINIFSDISELLSHSDVIYMIPIYIPNFKSSSDERSTKHLITPDNFRIYKHKFLRLKKRPFILHPGPRRDELDPDMDTQKENLFFDQVKVALKLRTLILFNYLQKN